VVCRGSLSFNSFGDLTQFAIFDKRDRDGESAAEKNEQSYSAAFFGAVTDADT
jgi:hypothetical protein